MEKRLKDVAKWLQTRSRGYGQKLEEIGRRHGQYLATKMNGQILFGVNNGVFTGKGLCILSSAAIEEATRRRFGDEVKTQGVHLKVIRKETNLITHHSHRAMRISFGDDNSITADATYRQFNFNVPNQLLVFPTIKEQRLYLGYEVATKDPGQTILEAKDMLRNGVFVNLGESDFEELVDVLVR